MIVLGVIFFLTLVLKRRWTWLLNIVALLYLIFFWSWGLNYHREPLASKLQLDATRMNVEAVNQFAQRAAAELNRLYNDQQNQAYSEARTREEAGRRVRRVVAAIDGSDWEAAHRIKTTWLGNPWLRAAGVDGVFNPLAHEPIISSTLLDVERPFIIAHELSHVRGYTDEGDANVIALFATLMSSDSAFQYSGWLNLWLYLRTAERDKLLNAGPQNDLRRIFDRARAEEILWIDNLQRAILDWFLKANSVEQGVRSYSRVVFLASGSEPYWQQYR